MTYFSMFARGLSGLCAIAATMILAEPAQAQFSVQIGELVQQDVGASMFPSAEGDDTDDFTFFTPRQSGLRVGVSYAADQSDTAEALNPEAAALNEFIDIGADYRQSVGEVDIALTGRIGTAQDTRPGLGNPTIWSTGVNLGLGSVSVAGSFAEQRNANTNDLVAYDAGVSYQTGPWGFSFTYMNGGTVEDEAVAVGRDERLEQYLLALNYNVAEGVQIGAYGGYVSLDSEVADLQGASDDEDIRGFVVGTGMHLAF